MRAGKLIHLITIQRSTETVDDLGTPVMTWTDLHSIRAHVEQQSTEQFIRNIGATDERVVVFHTRFVAGITNADRIMWRGTAHNIREIAVQGRDEWMELRTLTVDP